MSDVYNYNFHDILFLPNRFSVKYRFPSSILHFYPKITYRVIQTSVSQENIFKKSNKPLPTLGKTIGSNNSFTLIENNIMSLR